MDSARFDSLTRTLTAAGSRRQALATLAGSLGLLGWHGRDDAAAHNALKKCKKKSGKQKKACIKKAKAHNATHTVAAPAPSGTSGCTPNCSGGRNCGSNGCSGGSCGTCASGQRCDGGMCVEVPTISIVRTGTSDHHGDENGTNLTHCRYVVRYFDFDESNPPVITFWHDGAVESISGNHFENGYPHVDIVPFGITQVIVVTDPQTGEVLATGEPQVCESPA
jgi:hypothetical protein